jgi:hypothetical protein
VKKEGNGKYIASNEREFVNREYRYCKTNKNFAVDGCRPIVKSLLENKITSLRILKNKRKNATEF